MNGYCDQNRSAIDTVENPTAKQQQNKVKKKSPKNIEMKQVARAARMDSGYIQYTSSVYSSQSRRSDKR